MFKISGPLTLMKLRPHSLATAPASNVFPHPGGPKRQTPDGSLIGARENNGANKVGNCNVSFNVWRTLSNPPTSDHPMNMWQIENLTQYQHKSEHQIKEKDLLPEAVLPDYTYWITARTSNTWSHEKKLEALRKFI